MITRYKLSGLTCGNCINKVSTVFTEMNGIDNAEVTLDEVKIESSIDIGLKDLQTQLQQLGDKYQISAMEETITSEVTSEKNWLATYKPVLLIFVYILGTTLLIETLSDTFDVMRWMRHFMAGFFLVFSFFKLLNLKGFVESYKMYDIVAKQFPAWGYIYAFLELVLGIAFLIEFNPLVTNSITLIVMSVSIIGVLQSVLNKKKIRCACLGDVFNLPMSTITIIEDGLMIAMSAIMLWYYMG